MTTPDQHWLAEQSSHLLRTSDAVQRNRDARSLGAQAADSSHDLSDIVAAILHAAAEQWATTTVDRQSPAAVHSSASTLLSSASDAITAAIAGFHDQTRHELSEHDTQRTQFVADLLTGRADPGHLAQRAQRYGIRLSGSHVVTIAAAATLTESVVHDIDTLLAARYGAGNTASSWWEFSQSGFSNFEVAKVFNC